MHQRPAQHDTGQFDFGALLADKPVRSIGGRSSLQGCAGCDQSFRIVPGDDPPQVPPHSVFGRGIQVPN